MFACAITCVCVCFQMVGNVCVGDSPLSHYVTGHVVPEEPGCTTKRQTTTQTGTWNRNGIEKTPKIMNPYSPCLMKNMRCLNS
mgnify:FL=1